LIQKKKPPIDVCKTSINELKDKNILKPPDSSEEETHINNSKRDVKAKHHTVPQLKPYTPEEL
jgi:hypothetical protein